ncbi:MAG: AmmeMemoRadiSam system protein B [Candidatus Buchananbacteria bacterium RBG_13_39_9]|uniref:AmmeMemoRadiSam system protein B n=1 Tax=Candidatus Buchananbacteria bacterium RBG_13_39_9 TaxID=1797531 RepID=A0A1G1XQ66_9BACT|nr:MAG: AmmeMemoRadiSam system protein B [Candidatus Buchananbacteria bacterium RBG_13_39_9]
MINKIPKITFYICLLLLAEAIFASLMCKLSRPAAPQNLSELINSVKVEKQVSAEFVSGVVPHHDLAKQIIAKFFQEIAGLENPDIIVLISPDHFEKNTLADKPSLIALSQKTQEFMGLKVADNLGEFLGTKQNFIYNNSALGLDHGIINLLPYIKENLPQSEILPFLAPANLDLSQIINLTKELNNWPNEKIMVIASVDFSHYLPQSAAEFHDLKSQRVLINFIPSEFEKLDVDCYQCLYSARLFAGLKGKDKYKVIAHNNSFDFAGSNQSEETTSYFSVLWGRGDLGIQPQFQGKTILFLGDLMLDRGVEDFSEKNSLNYPFDKIKNFLKGIDYVASNLEGPIVKKPIDFGAHSLSFNFSPDILPVLKNNNLNVFSLANNHILNRGHEGFAETKELLSQNGFIFSGDPLKCSSDLATVTDEIIFFAVNKTYPQSCADQDIAASIKTLKQDFKNKFLIVSLHWGIEYQDKNSLGQQNLAHLLIDSGADLIIGHHPHVVQNIEKYKNKSIFYSLGNFIFDQYFSAATQQGLAVGLEIQPEKIVLRLFPLISEKSQIRLMTAAEQQEFLSNLAKISDQQLKKEIESGIMSINSKS